MSEQVWVSCHPLERLWVFDKGVSVMTAREKVASDLNLDPGSVFILYDNSPTEFNDAESLNTNARASVRVINCNQHD